MPEEVKEKEKTTTTLYVPRDLHRRWKLFSVNSDRAMNDVALIALKKYLNEQEKK